MTNTLYLAANQYWQAKADTNDIRHIHDVADETVTFTQTRKGADRQEVPASEFVAWIHGTQAALIDAPAEARISPGLDLGHRIRLLREMAGMSQQQLAQAAGISRSAVTFWETGRSGHVGKHLGRLAQVLNVDPEVLLTGMAHKNIEVTITPDENIMLGLYRQLDPLIKLQAQKWIERRVRSKDEE